VNIDALIVLLLAAQFKLGLYAFWKLSSRLDKLEKGAASSVGMEIIKEVAKKIEENTLLNNKQ